jgi:alpha-methylacyl-CoA racemase
MMLADHGAEVIRIERAGWSHPIPSDKDILLRNRSEILRLDLKSEADLARAKDICRAADALIEGFRPGVMERLALGPAVLCAENPRLAYGRVTGWGQEGPLALAAGHDINYIALSGNLHGYGRAGAPPTPPINAVGDFGGGGLLLAFGLLACILRARATGIGGVVDAAMVDGAALLNAQTYALLAAGMWKDERGTNLLDTGAAFYDSYQCADGQWLSIGALEPHFFAILKEKLALSSSQFDPSLRAELETLLRSQPRVHWLALLEGTDACVAPVLSLTEAPIHPHNAARGTFITVDGVLQPAPAPRFMEP